MKIQQVQEQRLTPAQRAELFAVHTRQHINELPAMVGLGADRTVNFTLPKTRLLSKIALVVEGELTIATAAATALARFSPYNILRRVQVSINNGFNPVNVSGAELYLTNIARHNGSVFKPIAGNERTVAPGLTVGTHPFRFVAEMPITLNERDMVGLVLLQNEETVVTVNIDIGAAASLVTPGGTTVLSFPSFRITPVITTFSIPAVPQAFPDLSVLKLLQSQVNEAPSSGQMTVRLPVGTTYRKIFLDMGGIAIPGTIDVLFNQADTPYSITPSYLRAINEEMYGDELPADVYALDFSYQGLANLGGLRDYIDTERLTEFWLRFPVAAGAAGRLVTTVFETLSRLRPQ